MPEQEEAKKTDDEILDDVEKSAKDSAMDTSTEKESKEEKSEETTKAEDTDLDKKEEAKEVSEEEIPKEFHKHPRWQKLKLERDEARQKLDEAQKSGLSQDEIEEYRKFSSSPSVVRMRLKDEGHTEESIDSKLQEMGFKVPEKGTDDFQLIVRGLNINPDTLDANTKAIIQDYANMTRVILNDWASKNLPNVLQPLEKDLQTLTQRDSGKEYASLMEKTVKDEGILDYKKDVEPELQKFLNENKEVQQEDVFEYFTKLTRRLSIERLKGGKRREERDKAKERLRPEKEGAVVKTAKIIGDKKYSDDDVLDAIEYKG